MTSTEVVTQTITVNRKFTIQHTGTGEDFIALTEHLCGPLDTRDGGDAVGAIITLAMFEMIENRETSWDYGGERISIVVDYDDDTYVWSPIPDDQSTQEGATRMTDTDWITMTTGEGDSTAMNNVPRSNMPLPNGMSYEQLDQANAHLSAMVTELAAERNALMTQRDQLQVRESDLTSERDAMQREVDYLTTRLDLSRSRNESLIQERDSLEQRQAQVLEEFHNFKCQVVEVATRYAVENDWCAVIDKALEELGLERVPFSYRGTLNVSIRFTAETTDRRELPDEEWVYNSINTYDIRQAIERAFGMDSDHADSSVGNIEFAVSDVEEDD